MATPFDTAQHAPPIAKQPPLDYYVPTVYIGLGGTGKEVLMRLRKRSHEKVGSRQRKFVRYLIIDTDVNQWWPRNEREEDYAPVKPQESEIVECPISESQFYTAFDLLEKQGDRRYSWLNPRMRDYKPPIDGAGTHRQFGRMAFLLNYESIRERIEGHIQGVFAAAARPDATAADELTVAQNTVEIVIVTSMAGGTGAGMFIDISYLVKDIFNTNDRLRNVPSKYISLIAVLPTAWEDQDKQNYRKFQRNAYASLLELEHYGTPRTGDELFLGKTDAASTQQDRVGFKAPWAAGKFIEGAGWNVCYLIDNASSLTQAAPQTLPETYRMIADYLYLDLHGSQFALQKRSNRCNLAMYQQHWLEPRVRRLPKDGEAVPTLVQDTDLVYATQHGCTFSSFGLAEITYNRERVYRAVGYLLASCLVSQRWLGAAASVKKSQYESWAKADTASIAFDKLLVTLCKISPDKNHLAIAKAECSKLRSATDYVAGGAMIDALISRHNANTHAGGRAYQTVLDRASDLMGTLDNLGPLREHLRKVSRHRANTLGTKVTTGLLAHYRDCLSVLQKSANKQSASRGEAVARLREADELWPPARRIAQKILFPRACDPAAQYVLSLYRSMAAPHVAKLATKTTQYIGSEEQGIPTDLNTHRTLFEYFEDANAQLERVGRYLETQFEALRGETGDYRKQSLLPNWDAKTYLDRINRTLVAYQEVGPAGSAMEDSGTRFNLDALNSLVLSGLRSSGTYDLANVRSLTDLVDLWLAKHQKQDKDIARIGDMLAQECQKILELAKLDLDTFKDGSVIDMLMLDHSPTARSGMLQVLVNYSAPYFPLDMQNQQQMVDNYRPAFDNLLGCGAGDIDDVSTANQSALVKELEGISNTQGQGLDGHLHSTLESEKSSLILCREVWGLPLLYYASLGTLYEAYLDDIQNADEYHIDWRETSENLPDIRIINPSVYELIRENVETVLFAMIVGNVNCDQAGNYHVAVVEQFGLGTDRLPIGSRISGIIKKACEQEAIRRQLENDRVDWEDNATPKKWAMVFASALNTYMHARNNVNLANARNSFPLRNCFQFLLEKIQDQLDDGGEGTQWLEYFRPKLEQKDGRAAVTQHEELFQQLLSEGILVQLSPFVPIFQVDWDKLHLIQLPESDPEAKQETRSTDDGE